MRGCCCMWHFVCVGEGPGKQHFSWADLDTADFVDLGSEAGPGGAAAHTLV